MRRTVAVFVALALSAGLLAGSQTPASPDVLLKAAMQKEQVDGDLPGALALYTDIVAKFPKDAAAPKALLQMAGIHERQGDREASRAIYQRIVATYSGGPAAKVAAERLAALNPQDDGPLDRSLNWPGNASMAASPAMSPDGRYVSYIDMNTRELTVRDLDTGNVRQLTQVFKADGFVDASAISHDGRFVAFASQEKGRAKSGVRILPISATEETTPRVIFEGAWTVPKEWSADSRRLLCVVERGNGRRAEGYDIGLLTVANGAMHVLKSFDPPLAPSHNVRLSPDGAFIAYDARTSASSRPRDLFLLPTDGGPAMAVFNEPANDQVVGWSPDGRHLVFISDRRGSTDLWALPVTQGRRAGDPVLLARDFRGDPLSMTAQGSLFYERAQENRSLFVAAVDPAAGVLIEPPVAVAANPQARAPRWSADGKSFAYLVPGAIAIRSADSGVVREVPLNLGYKWTYDWSPDGRTFAFRADDLNSREGVHLFNAETGALQLLLPYIEDVVGYYVPQFSAGGRSLTYFSSFFKNSTTPGVATFVERNLETGDERVAARFQRDASGPNKFGSVRSPDGRWILVETEQPSSLIVHEIATGKEHEVFRVGRANAIAARGGAQWTPDSRALIANVAGASPSEPRSLWWIPIEGGTAHPINIGLRTLVSDGIAVHPDGRHVAFVAGDPVAAKGASDGGGPQTEYRLLQNFLPKPAGARR